MQSFIWVIFLSFGFTVVQSWNDDTTIVYEDDIYYVMNEVEQRTADALEFAVIIQKHKLTANYSTEVVAQRDEIMSKASVTVLKIEKWIHDNNSTGQLVGETEECLAHLLELTTQDTLEYLDKLQNECWKNDAWLGDIEKVIVNLTELAQQGKDLYGEFLDENVKCTHAIDDPDCVSRVEASIRVKALDILNARGPYLDIVYSIDQGYERGVVVCQKIVYEKIDWIELNVVNGLRDCKP